jgi:hypothetical protein
MEVEPDDLRSDCLSCEAFRKAITCSVGMFVPCMFSGDIAELAVSDSVLEKWIEEHDGCEVLGRWQAMDSEALRSWLLILYDM